MGHSKETNKHSISKKEVDPKTNKRHRPDELPPHEGVVERVDVGGDERSPPVDVEPHRHQIGLGLRGEVFEPVVAVGKLGNLGRKKALAITTCAQA